MGELQQILDNGYGLVITRTDAASYTVVAVHQSGQSRPLSNYLDARLGNTVADGETADAALARLAGILFKTPGEYRAGRRRK